MFAYRAVVGLVGAAVVLLGLLLVPLPGPGWLVVFVGLAILASEFAWARRLLDWARLRLRVWTQWLGRQPPLVRGLVGLGALLGTAGAIGGYLAWQGVPFAGD